jgi:uncharacterized membrane protein YphA (DoxX/SURF4 family)
MKILAQLSRFLVGVEFIFSGFVKVIDPYGTGIKLQEYFEVFAQDLPAFKGFFDVFAHNAQTLSLIFCATELVLGVAVLFAFRMRLTAWVLLGMMGFFTFLTFYSAYFNKVTDCGCFGDFLKLKPWHSFWKDVISMVFISIIFVYRKKYKPFKLANLAVGMATIIAFGIGIYALRYLPPIDFLPYAVGKSIPEQMKPTGVKPDIEYTFLNKKTNEEMVSKEYLMDTLTYKYVSSVVLNEDAIRPKITDYSISNSEGNTATDSTFMGAKVLIIIKKIKDIDAKQITELENLSKSLAGTKIQAMILSSVSQDDFRNFKAANKLTIPSYAADEKVLKTMARTNPCVILLENGVVKGKWSNYSIPSKEELLNAL